MIPNHASASLSDLDLRMARAVPPGGNWRNIPHDIPSERLAQIRASYAAGGGSRSTYYGRLHPERPAYTIGTYYNRPGNGCFLHYDAVGGQHRTLSHREAARLQSFPDSFVFTGPQRAVCQQIGNAVPPLLAYQLALALGEPGRMVDVFAGAGGLSLGFEWAGWRSAAAVDIDRHAVATFNANMPAVAFVGDLQEADTQERLSTAAKAGTGRLALVGGPPCQGFSTGGNRRSADDARNGLHASYAALLARLRPDIFVFENVLGLLSMEGGRFLLHILQGFHAVGYEVCVWKLNAADYGVPQRRERVILVGVPKGSSLPSPPSPWTSPVPSDLLGLPRVCGVAEALDDLPPLLAGQDGKGLAYRSPPATHFQKFVRGMMKPSEYVFGGQLQHDSGGRPSSVRRVVGDAGALYAG
ncbi:DNA (cytosine-5-)-methyltransferase [Roseomonas sp. HF4]|uniref:DNA cytosine methyltransferase n=1 Tax=Roseomonas sp. HF4 TaxID=2562313 RepID=UPI001F0E6DBA|nr:DNA (cytosine-5-)-methyltransferase [Roseomonas sp. HF4]